MSRVITPSDAASSPGLTRTFSWLRPDESGTLGASAILKLATVLASLATRIANLSLGTGVHGTQMGNLVAQYLHFLTPAAANQEFGVKHGLKRIPVGYLVTDRDKAAHVYNGSAAAWSSDTLYLKCDVSAVTLTLVVF